MVQMPEWFSPEAARASRRKRSSDDSSWATSSGRNFNATKAAELRVLGLVDDPHATTTEFAEDAVARDRLSDHSWGKSLGWSMLEGIAATVKRRPELGLSSCARLRWQE